MAIGLGGIVLILFLEVACEECRGQELKEGSQPAVLTKREDDKISIWNLATQAYFRYVIRSKLLDHHTV